MNEDKTLKENIKEAHSPAEFWLGEIKDSQTVFNKWSKRSDEVESVYRGENEPTLEKFNILWSNTETLRPILFSRTPKPQIERRFKEEEDNVTARLAAEVLERCADYCVQIEGHEYEAVMEKNVLDSLLSGRIISRVVYDPYFETKDDTFREPTGDETFELETGGTEIPNLEERGVRVPGEEEKSWEEAYIKYVYRKDFLHSRGQIWEDVWWVAFAADLDKDELIEQFGAEKAAKIQISTISTEEAAKEREKTGEQGHREVKTVRVWEIWNKRDLEVIFVAEDNKFILKREKDPLNLESFFPCPRPVYSIFTNDSLIPVPEYTLYQYQAEELNILTRRITRLTAALKVRGIYDQSITSIPNLLNGEENELIPDPDFGKLAQAKGIEGAISWMPIANIGDTISKLIALRQDTSHTIYELTGISDILRGASDPRETATAQRIKGQYGAMRIRKRQKEIQRYARDLIRLLVEVIAEQFSPDTLMVMSGIEQRQFEGTGMKKVVELLRNDALRGFRIDIETDSTIIEDEEREKKEVMEFMVASSQFMGSAFQAVESGMMPPQIAQEIMLFASRRFRVGRKLEGALMKIGQSPPQNKDKEGKQAELQAKTQIEMAKLQQKDSQFKQEIQLEMGKLQVKMLEIKDKKVIAQMKVQADLYEAMIDQKTVEINARGGAN